jgi:hypothetical protein
MQQQKTANLVNDKFNSFRSDVTTPSTNHETTVAPEKKDWPRYATSEITVNPIKLITENGIINTTLKTESGSNIQLSLIKLSFMKTTTIYLLNRRASCQNFACPGFL